MNDFFNNNNNNSNYNHIQYIIHHDKFFSIN